MEFNVLPRARILSPQIRQRTNQTTNQTVNVILPQQQKQLIMMFNLSHHQQRQHHLNQSQLMMKTHHINHESRKMIMTQIHIKTFNLVKFNIIQMDVLVEMSI